MINRLFIKILFSLVLLPMTVLSTQYDWRIMPLGNSITVGVHGSDPVGGYRDDLQILLQNNGYGFNFVGTRLDGDPQVFDVEHQGTGGIRADEVLLQIDTWLIANPPDFVLLHIGTNDVSNGDDVNSTADEISQILDHIYNFDPEIQILLASIVPRDDPRSVFSEDLNHEIRNLVTTKQNENYLVHYVPINEAFTENANWSSEYLDDSVHPNNEGYHVMAQEWYDVLATVIDGDPPPPPPSVQPDSFHIVSGNGQTGVVHNILPEPLVVQVVDENDDPAPDVQLHFESRSGNGAVQTVGSGGTQFIEAESGLINSPCKIVDDYSVSNDAYVVSDVRESGDFSLTVTVKSEADYYIWGRVFAPTIDEDSFYLTVDDSQDTITWDLWQHENWYWEEVADRTLGRMSFHFNPGKHYINFITREEGSRVDKIVITNDPDFIPKGVAGFPDIYTNQNGNAEIYWLLGNEIGTQQIKVTSPALSEQSLIFEAEANSDGDPPPPPVVQPVAMNIVSGNGQSGLVYSVLPAPLVVKVVDENDNPTSDVQLHFESVIGNGAIQTNGIGGTQFIEAESGSINSPCKIVGDVSASNNAYIVSDVRKSGDFTLTVTISEESDFYLWGRVFAPSTDEDSFQLLVDDSSDTLLWDLWEHGNWYWEEVADRSLGRLSFHLTTGKHFIKFITREAQSRLDKIVITNDANFIPQGVYGFPDIYTDSNGEAEVYWLLGNVIGNQQIEVTSPLLSGQSLVFEANAYSDEIQMVNLSGAINYYTENQSVENIGVHLNSTHVDSSDNLGKYSFLNMLAGENYSLKTDSNQVAENAADVIISYDAALASRYAVGLENLTPNQILAADADNDGQILTYDASLIARFAVGLGPIGNSKVGNWIFTPGSYEYVNLDSSVASANFTGIVRGDVHGGWQPSGLGKKLIVETSLLQNVYSIVEDTLIFELPIQATETIYSFDLDLSFDSNDFEFVKLDLSQLNKSFHILENRDFDRIRIGGFNQNGTNEESKILLKYLIKSENSSQISLNLFRINNNSSIKSSFDFKSNAEFPNQFVLYQNYPNPFNQETILSYSLPNPNQVTIRIYNSIGQEVWALVRTYETAGIKQVRFSGKDRFGVDLQSGNYYVRLQIGDSNILNQKISIVR
jgi:acyl-CoA thioesterase I